MSQNSENGKSQGGLKSLLGELPFDRLKDELQHGFSALSEKAVETAEDKISGLSDKLNGVADGGGVAGTAAKKGMEEAVQGGSPVKGALKGGLSGAKDKVKEKLGGGGKGGGGGKATKATNIIEEIDVGVPVSVAYNQWTQFQDYSKFMKKVDGAEQDEAKVNFKAQVFWSHRSWEAKVLEQVPDERIVWRSKGEKGHVDGSVTFHELAPRLTRILVVLEYYPQGLFERTGNLWRAQGRRARLELKHFRRHVMMDVILNPDDVEGWRGEIHDGEVERSHDEVVEEEEQQQDDESGDESDEDYDEEADDEGGDESDDEAADEYDEGESEDEEPADEYDEGEPEDDEGAADEYDEGEEPQEEDEGEPDEDDEGEEPQEDEEAADEEEEAPPRRRRRRASTR